MRTQVQPKSKRGYKILEVHCGAREGARAHRGDYEPAWKACRAPMCRPSATLICAPPRSTSFALSGPEPGESSHPQGPSWGTPMHPGMEGTRILHTLAVAMGHDNLGVLLQRLDHVMAKEEQRPIPRRACRRPLRPPHHLLKCGDCGGTVADNDTSSASVTRHPGCLCEG